METLDQRAAAIKNVISANKGILIAKGVTTAELTAEKIRQHLLQDMKSAVKQVDTLRTGTKDRIAVDVSWADFVKEKWGFAISDNHAADSFYNAIGVNPSQSTVQSLMTMPDFDEGFRWLVPEIIREAVRLGLRKAPIYPNLIAAEETVSQPSVIMPFINMSDATMSKLNEAETIPTGSASFDQKTVKLNKVGVGLKFTDEVLQFVTLSLLSLYLQDVGVKMNTSLDNLAIDTLINGDQADGSEASAVIGTDSGTKFEYVDLLRTWIRMSRLGRMPQAMLSNENPALSILQFPEFKGFAGQQVLQRISLRTPIPQTQNYFIHGAMDENDLLMLIDTTSAMVKLNCIALRVESERIVERQINGTYVTMTTGFANLFRDARIILDKTVAFSGQGFPSWMNVSAAEVQPFKG